MAAVVVHVNELGCHNFYQVSGDASAQAITTEKIYVLGVQLFATGGADLTASAFVVLEDQNGSEFLSVGPGSTTKSNHEEVFFRRPLLVNGLRVDIGPGAGNQIAVIFYE